MSEAHPLKSYRDHHIPALSQEAMARLIGVDRLTIHRWETGKRKPDRKFLAKITENTGIPARDLRPDLVELLGAADA